MLYELYTSHMQIVISGGRSSDGRACLACENTKIDTWHLRINFGIMPTYLLKIWMNSLNRIITGAFHSNRAMPGTLKMANVTKKGDRDIYP